MNETSKQYSVNEIFLSFQGEGFNSGKPALFLRFAGCNLRCPFCDTDYTAYECMSAAAIVERLRSYGMPEGTLLVITGGEPALQIDESLVLMLKKEGWYIAVETNGTHRLPAGVDWVTLSPKEHTDVVLTQADELKIVYQNQDVEGWRARIRAQHYFLQPCSQMNTDEVMQYIYRHPWWRLSLQTQKYIHIR